MIDINILIARLKENKWYYKEAETEILEVEIPHYINLNDLAVELIKENTTRPTLKKIITKSKHLHYKKRKEIQAIIHEGCQNCEAGYIKIPRAKAFDEIKFNPINLMELHEYPTIRIPCTCTGIKPDIKTFLEDLQNYQTTNPLLYEVFYLMMYGYMSMWLTGNRFNKFDEFNLYEIWKVAHDPNSVLKVDDLRFKNLFGHEVKITKPALKKVVNNITETYKHKIYEGE